MELHDGSFMTRTWTGNCLLDLVGCLIKPFPIFRKLAEVALSGWSKTIHDPLMILGTELKPLIHITKFTVQDYVYEISQYALITADSV